MAVTLHVDLLWTDLEDFVEHFEEQLNGANAKVLLGERTDAVLWDTVVDGYGPGADEVKHMGVENYTRIIATSAGTTSKNYWIWTFALDDPEEPKAAISIVRYRRDRLKVVVYDFFESGYAERLHNWLLPRWGTSGIEDLQQETAPDLPRMPKPRTYQINEETQRKATVAHYGITELRLTQKIACDLVGIEVKTWRKYKDRGDILSHGDFRRKVGETVSAYAARTYNLQRRQS